MKYITADETAKIHDEVIKETGGHTGMISRSNLDFLVDQMEIPKSIERKAATLFYGILTSHPFVDGNKRTAIASIEIFLRENKKELIAEDEELWDIVHRISSEKLKFEEVVNWIKKKIK